MDDIAKILASLEKSGRLIDGATEPPLIAPKASSLTQPVVSSQINVITEKGQEDELLRLLALPLMMKFQEKNSEEQKEDIITCIKIFSSTNPLRNIEASKYFS